MSGNLEGIAPILMPSAHSLTQAAIDIKRASESLSDEEMWKKPKDSPSVAFHLRHIAGSIDRLLTYTRGEQLNAQQFDKLAAESEFDENLNSEKLVESAVSQIEKAVDFLLLVDVETLFEKRVVGRKNLPTNVFGLLFHIAEHTQRHVGQIITTAKIVRLR